MKLFNINISYFFYFANIWNILFKVQLWNMCEVIGYWYIWYSDFLLQYFSFCRYLTNSQQVTIVHAHQYVWSYQILIFLIFWYLCTFFFFILQLFEISCSKFNCECMPICVKLSDIDILGSTTLAFQLLNWPPYSYLSETLGYDSHESFSNYAEN